MSNEWMTNALLSGGKGTPTDDMGLAFFKRVSRGIKTIGRAAGGTVRAGVKGISKALHSVPVIGPGLDAVFELNPLVAPLTVAANIAAGKRIDKAVYEGFKQKIKAYQDIAPYVQTVVQIVPGIGQGVSGAIAAANALSKGRPITEALVAAARGALPGGPAAAAVYDVAVAAIQGKPIAEVALNAIPGLDPDQKKLVVSAVMAAKDIASGKKVDEALYNRGKELLPPDARKALDVGVAIAQGQKLQQITQKAIPGAIPKFFQLGKKQAAASPVMKAGAELLAEHPEARNGFFAGLGFMQHKITPVAMLSMRGALTPDQKKGFDMAVSAHVGEVAKPVPKTVPPAQRFGFYITQGMQGNKPTRKTEMMKIVVTNKDTRAGAGKAIAQIKKDYPQPAEKGFWAFWHRIIKGMGIKAQTA